MSIRIKSFAVRANARSRSDLGHVTLLPKLTNREKADPAAVGVVEQRVHKAPLCEIRPSGPRCGMCVAKDAFICTSGAVLIRPRQFGPTMDRRACPPGPLTAVLAPRLAPDLLEARGNDQKMLDAVLRAFLHQSFDRFRRRDDDGEIH